MSFMASYPQTSEAVRDVRQPRIIRARLIHRDGEEEDVVVRNVTPTGLGASSRGSAPVRGERLVVVLPGNQQVSGVVRWFSGRSFGIELDGPLDMDALAIALQRQAQATQTSVAWHVENRHRVVTPIADPSRVRRV